MKGKAKNLASLKAPKNPKRIRTSMSHVGVGPHLMKPRTPKGGRKKVSKRSLRKA
jgi:hypothetical protein